MFRRNSPNSLVGGAPCIAVALLAANLLVASCNDNDPGSPETATTAPQATPKPTSPPPAQEAPIFELHRDQLVGCESVERPLGESEALRLASEVPAPSGLPRTEFTVINHGESLISANTVSIDFETVDTQEKRYIYDYGEIIIDGGDGTATFIDVNDFSHVNPGEVQIHFEACNVAD